MRTRMSEDIILDWETQFTRWECQERRIEQFICLVWLVEYLSLNDELINAGHSIRQGEAIRPKDSCRCYAANGVKFWLLKFSFDAKMRQKFNSNCQTWLLSFLFDGKTPQKCGFKWSSTLGLDTCVHQMVIWQVKFFLRIFASNRKWRSQVWQLFFVLMALPVLYLDTWV